MGEMEVAKEALFGASTQRAVLNFPISGKEIDGRVIRAYGMIKSAAAESNASLGELDGQIAKLICEAAGEVADGKHAAHFPIDVYQTGSGTSTNMNVNEVIANRCSQLAGKEIGSHEPAHPNDHVNMGQSSNDTFPTAVHVATALALRDELLPALAQLQRGLQGRAEAFFDVIKIGRTHLMDATPMRLGQEFSGYARQVEKGQARVEKAIEATLEIPLGGTAIGTGLNRHLDFPKKAIKILAERTGLALREAENPFEAQASRDGLVEAHGYLNAVAVSFFKIANDLRLLASGPRCSLGEITLPATQPGSSIMPGKVNPVMCESMTQVAARVFGNQNTVTWAGANGQFELNVFMPVMADAILESITLLANVARAFDEKCVSAGLDANRERCGELVELSLSMVTSLVPYIGYDRASALAKEALKSRKTVRELCLEKADDLGITKEIIEKALDAEWMCGEAGK